MSYGDNVKFLPGYRQVSDEEMVARMMAQDEFTLFHVEFEQQNRHLSDWQYFLKKEEFHHKLRQSMTLVKK
jgi:hypothetical protein